MKSKNARSEQASLPDRPRHVLALAIKDQLRWVRRFRPETAEEVDRFKALLAEHMPDVFGDKKTRRNGRSVAA